MNEMMRKAGQIIDSQLDEIIKAQSEGREVQALTILHTLDALDCYRRIKSHSEKMNFDEFKKFYQDYQKSNSDRHLKLPTNSS